MNRRDFIKSGMALGGLVGVSGLSLANSACTSLDRIFQVQNNSLEDGILIVGGGIAGLVAAYECRKAQVPYRIVDANERFGGRIQTLRHFNDSNQSVEIGADFFEAFQKDTLQLAAELGLELQKNLGNDKIEDQVFANSGHLYRMKDIATKTNDFKKALKLFLANESQSYDSMSIAEVFSKLKPHVDADVLNAFEQVLQSKFGTEVDQISSLHWIQYLSKISELSPSEQRTSYSFKGGNQILVETLADRVSGVIPEYFSRNSFELVAIREKMSMIECTFRYGNRTEVLRAGQVLITIPPAQLAKVEGWNELEIPSAWKSMSRDIRMSQHSRIAMGFKEKFWKLRAPENVGTIIGPRLAGVYTETTRGQDGNRGVLVCQRGGILGLSTGATAPEEVMRELSFYYPKIRDLYDGNSHVMNWTKRNHILGGMCIFPPGTYAKYVGQMSDAQIRGQLALAGEAYNDSMTGTVSSAIESARKQSKKLIAIRNRSLEKNS